MDKQNLRNMLLAGSLAVVILFGWDMLMKHYYPNMNKPAEVAAGAPAAAAANGIPAPQASATGKPTREGGLTNPADQALEAKDLVTALNPATRVPIAAPGLSGSINLVGGVVDDLSTNRHTAAAEKNSPAQRIFSPAGTPAQQFAQFGWVRPDSQPDPALPGAATQWTAPAGAKLTPQSPVTLTWANSAGQSFALTYAIDADYLITVTQAVANAGTAPLLAKPYALITRTSKTASVDTWNVQSGPFGAYDGKVSFSTNYTDVTPSQPVSNAGKTDWVGFTDIYWMSALVPDKAGATSDFRALDASTYRADLLYPDVAVAPGATNALTTKLFAGAKESSVLDRYAAGGITNFVGHQGAHPVDIGKPDPVGLAGIADRLAGGNIGVIGAE